VYDQWLPGIGIKAPVYDKYKCIVCCAKIFLTPLCVTTTTIAAANTTAVSTGQSSSACITSTSAVSSASSVVRGRPQPQLQTTSASAEITSLAKQQLTYYTRKQKIKENQHKSFVKEQAKKMEVLELQKRYYTAKLRRLGEK